MPMRRRGHEEHGHSQPSNGDAEGRGAPFVFSADKRAAVVGFAPGAAIGLLVGWALGIGRINVTGLTAPRVKPRIPAPPRGSTNAWIPAAIRLAAAAVAAGSLWNDSSSMRPSFSTSRW